MMSDTEKSPVAPKSRWPRRLSWALAATGLLMAGLWAGGPHAVRYAATEWATGLGRSLSLGEITFAPWALRLTIGDIRLQDKDGSPLLAIKRLNVDAEGLPLLIGRSELAELTLDAPQVWARRDAQGVWNWARFAHDAAGPASPDAQQDSEPAKMLISQLALNKGQIQVQDALAGNVSRQVLPLDFQLKDLSTLPDNHGRYRLAARLDDGTELDWQGSLLLQPLKSDGLLKVRGFSLASVWPYVQPHLKLAAPQGRLSLTLPYHFDLQGKQPVLTSQGFAANLDALALAAPASGSPFRLAKVAISGGEFDLARRQLTLGSLQLSGGEVASVLDVHGKPDWLAALPAPAATVSPDTRTASPGWTVLLPQIRLSDWQWRATHRGFVTPLSASGKLDSLQASVKMDAKGALNVSGATLALSGLSAASGKQPPFVQLGALTLAASEADIARHRIHVGDLALQGLQLSASRSKDGHLDVADALRPLPAPAAAVAANVKATPWQIRYPAIALQQGALAWRDATTAQPVALKAMLNQLDISGDPQQGFALALTAGIGAGQLALAGKLAANLQDIRATVDARGLPLKDVAPYALDKTVLRFAAGELSAKLDVGLQQQQWQASGSVALDKLALYEPGQREMLLGWRSLQLSALKAQPQRVSIGDVRLVSPQLRLILDEKRVPNFAHLLKPQPAAARPAATAKPAAAPVVDVRAIRVRDARLDFADLGLNPSFGTRIHSLSGTVLGLSSKPGRRGTVTLDGRVDQFGDVRIRGALSPFEVTRDLDMALNFRNIPLGSLNPYSMTFAGWKITDGRLSTELRYLLKDRQLKGDNRMVIDHIQLGDEVANYEGSRLPLRLAVAILEDSDGRIDLSLPVAGSLDSPEFSYGHLVWQAIRNVLVKVVTAPFRALFGGEGFDSIYVDAGDDRIPPPEREKLQKLADAMSKRPKLMLALGGGFDAALDSRELARNRVDHDILKRAAYKLQPDEPLPLPDMGDPAIRKAVGDVYAAQFGRFAWLKRVATEADTAARAQAMRGEMLAAQKVDDAALTALAKVRGEAARKLLLDARPELAERISMLSPEQVKADKDGVPLLIKLK